MVNTKVTPRKDPKCPMCPFRSADKEAMRAHLVVCGMNKMERTYKCASYDYATDKNSNLQRHKKRHVVAVSSESTEPRKESTEDEWMRSDPGNLEDILGVSLSEQEKSESSSSSSDESENEEPELDPTIRKPTTPEPVCAPKRKSCEEKQSSSVKDSIVKQWQSGPQKIAKICRPPQFQPPAMNQVSTLKDSESSTPTPPKEPKSSVTRVSTGVQTDPLRNRRVVWKTTKYQEGDRQIEIVEMDETEFSEI